MEDRLNALGGRWQSSRGPATGTAVIGTIPVAMTLQGGLLVAATT